MSADLIAQLRALRTTRVDLGDGVSVSVIRPSEVEMGRLIQRIVRADLADEELALTYVTGWQGVTEATLLGQSLGSAAAVPFAADLWREVAGDRAEWVRTIAAEVVKSVETYITKRADAAKKSNGSSTPDTTGSCSATTGPSPATPSA